MAKKEATKELIEQAEALPPTNNPRVPATIDALDYEELAKDAGAGFETITGADKAIPFLTVLQKGSPQVDDTTPKYIEGARAGMLYNTVFGNLYSGKDGVEVIYCGFKSALVRWKARETGGGFVGHVQANDPILATGKPNAKGQLVLTEGDLIIDTAYHVVLVIDGADYIPAIISMASTQKKVSRLWNTTASMMTLKLGEKTVKAPLYSHVWRLTTVPQQKDQYTWYLYKVDVEGLCNREQYTAAKAYYQSFKADEIKIGAPPVDLEEHNSAPSGGISQDGEVPF